MNGRHILLFAALWGLAGVILGACFDHMASAKMTHGIETALRYQQLYAVVIAGTGLALRFGVMRAEERRPLFHAACLFVAGTVIFCGSLFTAGLSGVAFFNYGAPAGGILMIAGWLVLARVALAGQD